MKLRYFQILILLSIWNLMAGCGTESETSYYDNGKVKWTAEKKDGIFHGRFKSYYESGALKSEGVWRNGIGNGFIKRFYENGVVKESSTWKNQQLDGSVELFHPNSTRQLKAQYKEGRKVSEYLIFNVDGSLKERHIYNNAGDLVYLANFERNGGKSLELFFPTFKIETRGDSIRLVVASVVNVEGDVSIILGQEDNKRFVALTKPYQLSNRGATDIAIPKHNPSQLFYRLSFIPSANDTIEEFSIEKRVLKVQEEPIEEFENEFINS